MWDVFPAVDVEIARLAAKQDGEVTRAQLLDLGVSSSAIGRRMTGGRLHAKHRGVYLVGHPVDPEFAAERAALLACGEYAHLSHRTAGWLWEMLPRPAGRIEVTLAKGHRRRREVIVHRSRRLEPGDTTTRHGLRVTTVERTILDLAEVLEPAELERAVEQAFAGKRVTERQLRALIKRSRGRRGVATLKAFLDYRGDRGYTRSQAEDVMRRLARRARLPQPRANQRVAGYEVDFLWPKQRVVVEVDSWKHHSSRTAFERDRRKSADLEAAGYRVIAVTWRQLTEEPEATAATIAAALAIASAA